MLPDIPAVYFLYVKEDEPIYIGQSQSLSKRLNYAHHHGDVFLKTQGLKIAWLYVTNKGALPDIEGAMIRKYRPKLNTKIPRVVKLSPRLPHISVYPDDAKRIKKLKKQFITNPETIKAALDSLTKKVNP